MRWAAVRLRRSYGAPLRNPHIKKLRRTKLGWPPKKKPSPASASSSDTPYASVSAASAHARRACAGSAATWRVSGGQFLPVCEREVAFCCFGSRRSSERVATM
eukprot:3564072-Prymnesium_polylepis.1